MLICEDTCYVNDNRVCGNKPVGGGTVVYESEADADTMKLNFNNRPI